MQSLADQVLTGAGLPGKLRWLTAASIYLTFNVIARVASREDRSNRPIVGTAVLAPHYAVD